MKRAAITLVAIFSFLLPGILFTQSVYAVDTIGQACQNADPNNLPPICKDFAKPSTDNPLFGPDGVLTKVVNILSLAAGVLAVFVILIGGIKMVVSSGDSNGVASARRTVLYAVISLVIVASAQAAVHFLLSKL